MSLVLTGTSSGGTIASSSTNVPVVLQDSSGNTNTCQAWVNFVGSSGSINASFNVSSITRAGAGQYQINFTNAMIDANYSALATCTNRGGGSAPTANYSIGYGTASSANTNGTYSTSAIQFYSQGAVGTNIDPASVSIAIFR